jgi:hypothetical protein
MNVDDLPTDEQIQARVTLPRGWKYGWTGSLRFVVAYRADRTARTRPYRTDDVKRLLAEIAAKDKLRVE